MYKVEVERTYKGRTEEWIVWRRYKQFLKLDEKLKKKVHTHTHTQRSAASFSCYSFIPLLQKFPVGRLPPKDRDKHNTKVIEFRLRSLDDYVIELVKHNVTMRSAERYATIKTFNFVPTHCTHACDAAMLRYSSSRISLAIASRRSRLRSNNCNAISA